MTSVLKNVYIDNLADIFNKYNNKYHDTIKMKPVDVKSSTYIVYLIENDEKNIKFKVDVYIGILKCKKVYEKGYTPNWSEEVFMIKKDKNTVPWAYVNSDLNG